MSDTTTLLTHSSRTCAQLSHFRRIEDSLISWKQIRLVTTHLLSSEPEEIANQITQHKASPELDKLLIANTSLDVLQIPFRSANSHKLLWKLFAMECAHSWDSKWIYPACLHHTLSSAHTRADHCWRLLPPTSSKTQILTLFKNTTKWMLNPPTSDSLKTQIGPIPLAPNVCRLADFHSLLYLDPKVATFSNTKHVSWVFQAHLAPDELNITRFLTLHDYCRSTQPEWNVSSFFTYSTYKQQWSR